MKLFHVVTTSFDIRYPTCHMINCHHVTWSTTELRKSSYPPHLLKKMTSPDTCQPVSVSIPCLFPFPEQHVLMIHVISLCHCCRNKCHCLLFLVARQLLHASSSRGAVLMWWSSKRDISGSKWTTVYGRCVRWQGGDMSKMSYTSRGIEDSTGRKRFMNCEEGDLSSRTRVFLIKI